MKQTIVVTGYVHERLNWEYMLKDEYLDKIPRLGTVPVKITIEIDTDADYTSETQDRKNNETADKTKRV